jgi:hypothetical protein
MAWGIFSFLPKSQSGQSLTHPFVRQIFNRALAQTSLIKTVKD